MNKIYDCGRHFTRSGSTKINPTSHGRIVCSACDALSMGGACTVLNSLWWSKLVTVKVRFQLGNDRLSHGAAVIWLWEETRSSVSCVAPERLKKWDEEDEKFTAESLWASTFCWRAQRYFHLLRISSSKLSQHCIHMSGTPCIAQDRGSWGQAAASPSQSGRGSWGWFGAGISVQRDCFTWEMPLREVFWVTAGDAQHLMISPSARLHSSLQNQWKATWHRKRNGFTVFFPLPPKMSVVLTAGILQECCPSDDQPTAQSWAQRRRAVTLEDSLLSCVSRQERRRALGARAPSLPLSPAVAVGRCRLSFAPQLN